MQKIDDREINTMLELCIIEESNILWSSTVVLIEKPGKSRVCIDNRKLNTVTNILDI